MSKELFTVKEIEYILKETMNHKGITVKSISSLTGISINTLYKWRSTDMRLSHNKIDAIINCLRTHYNDLLENTLNNYR